MSPDDPRHGTYAGAVAHYLSGVKTCAPCREAGAAYRRDRRTRLYFARSSNLMVPSIGTIRRVQALVALGHSMRDIDEALGRRYGYTSLKLKRYPVTTYPKVAEEYAEVYERLCMIRPEGSLADRTRRLAARNGWLPPLAWLDIDDPNEVPDTSKPEKRPSAGRPTAHTLEDFDWLVSNGESEETALARLGVTRYAIEAARRRSEVA